MPAVKITGGNFDSEVMASERTVLLDFWAEWCGPCRMIAPVIDEIADGNEDVKVGKINVDEEQELAVRFGVMSIPTLIAVKDGKVAVRREGVLPKSAILEMLK